MVRKWIRECTPQSCSTPGPSVSLLGRPPLPRRRCESELQYVGGIDQQRDPARLALLGHIEEDNYDPGNDNGTVEASHLEEAAEKSRRKLELGPSAPTCSLGLYATELPRSGHECFWLPRSLEVGWH